MPTYRRLRREPPRHASRERPPENVFDALANEAARRILVRSPVEATTAADPIGRIDASLPTVYCRTGRC